jgi:hypothetical protein
VALLAILRALRRAVQRDLGTVGSGFYGLNGVNNFFFFVFLLIYGALESGLPPWSAYPFLFLLGFLLLFPMSSDPLDKIPAERMSLWPLTGSQRFSLRILSLALSPVSWIAALLLLKTATLTVAIPFLGLALVAQLIPRWYGLTAVIRIPLLPGTLGALVSNNLRQLLTVLDAWVAIMLCAIATAWRMFNPHSGAESLPMLGLLIALALSTYAQSLFGLDSESAITRCRLLPLRGRDILFAKDLAFLGLLLILTLFLNPLPALTFGLTSLVIGHESSVRMSISQRRWRFTAGRLLPAGALQAVASVTLGLMELRKGPAILAVVLAIYSVTLPWYGRRLESLV